MKTVVEEINQIGQSIWYDNIERKLLEDGTLAEMVQRSEIRGITSNPSIFNKAISQSNDYDQEIKIHLQSDLSREEIYERLAIKDIQSATDLFRDLYQETEGTDGYVSLEVSPYLAHDTDKTISEAIRLWKAVDRPNLMVKIPATMEGLPAITEVISEGINVNVTLIFGLSRYREVREAYLAGLEKRLEAGGDISKIASVASFFISRIDSKVDKKLESMQLSSPAELQDRIQKLFGKAAIASGKLAFVEYEKTFTEDERFQSLKKSGGNRQRALWASTSTKNPEYHDTIYVEELIGPGTVNTVPPQTLMAFYDHGKVENTIGRDHVISGKVFEDLGALGIDIEEVAQELESEGVKAFADAYTSLLDSLESRMREFRAAGE
jgi:transaldolase